MSFQRRCYLLMTVDPVHIGTGGIRLGRVDLSIVREPGTKLPKIPGTSLSGAIRQYAAARYGKRRCAGQGQPGEEREGHCGQPTCPICYTFGAVTGERTYSGVVSIGDARLLLFPVYSMTGPVWVTSPATLADFGIKVREITGDRAKWSSKNLTKQRHLNLGWLMVEREGDLSLGNLPNEIPPQVRQRIVLISDKLFSQVVNSNLEVRTSVSINPETGAAEEGALYTYEAIPRAAILWMEVVVDDYRRAFPSKSRLDKWRNLLEGNDEGVKESLLRQWRLLRAQDEKSELAKAVEKASSWVREDLARYKENDWHSAADVVTAGLEWAEHLGIGGMGTRGFGRIRSWEVNCEHDNAEPGQTGR